LQLLAATTKVMLPLRPVFVDLGIVKPQDLIAGILRLAELDLRR
jgi:hypothetical protein